VEVVKRKKLKRIRESIRFRKTQALWAACRMNWRIIRKVTRREERRKRRETRIAGANSHRASAKALQA
jgi:hypothetical protein